MKVPVTDAMASVVEPDEPLAAARTLLIVPPAVSAPSAPDPNWQRPAEHGTPAPQDVPHAPQLAELVRRSVSHPSLAVLLQSPKFVLQVNPHTPDAHVVVALAAVAHALPQRPQLESELVVLTSQPSLVVLLQLAKPVSHAAIPHAPERQNSLALGSEHTVPHAPQFAGSRLVLVHAPEQLVRPVPHEAEHVPAAQS